MFDDNDELPDDVIPLTPEVLEELGKIVRPALWERDALDYSEAEKAAHIERLRATGIEIDKLGGMCPVQAEGRMDGRPFYFRARWDSWSVGVAPVGGSFDDAVEAQMLVDPSCMGGWAYEEDYGDGGGYDAGWMTNREALEFIEQAAKRFRDEVTP